MVLFNVLSTVIIAGINFFTIPIFTRLLDTAGYGLVNIYTAWVQISTVLVGLKVDGTIGSASANLPEEDQGPYQYSVSILALVFFAVLFGVALVFLEPLSRLLEMDSVLIICMMLQSIGSLLITLCSMRFIFRKEGQYNFAMSVGLCVSTTVLSIVLVCVVFPGTDAFYGRVIGLTIPNLIIGIVVFVALCHKYARGFRLSYWRFCIPLALPLIFHSLSQLVLSQTGKIAIQHIFDDSIAGIYSIAVVVVMLLNAIYGALNNAFVPFMYDDLAGKNSEETKQRHFNNYFCEFTIGTIAFVMISPEILKLMSTEAYWGSLGILPLLVIGQYCIFLYSFPVNYEFYKMRTKSIAVGTLLAAIVNVILSVILIPSHGIWGAAIATLVAYLCLFVFHFCVARFMLGDRNYAAWKFGAGLLLVTAMSLMYYPLSDLAIVRWSIGLVALLAIAAKVVKTRQIF